MNATKVTLTQPALASKIRKLGFTKSVMDSGKSTFVKSISTPTVFGDRGWIIIRVELINWAITGNDWKVNRVSLETETTNSRNIINERVNKELTSTLDSLMALPRI